MIPFNYILWKFTEGFQLTKSQEKNDHLMNMYDIKYSWYIGMEFDIVKCA